MRIAFAGTPEVAVPSLQALHEAGHDIACVITRPDAPAGRGRTLRASAVADAAAAIGLPIQKPARLIELEASLRDLRLDAIAVVAYGDLVPASMLAIPLHGWINLHFSLLPAWRGAAPVQHAILAGDDIAGACTFRLDEGLDTGPVFGSVTRAISDRDTASSLLAALAQDGAVLLTQTMAALPDLQPLSQGSDGVSLAPKLRKSDAELHWSDPALALSRRVRACTEEPGAWTICAGQRVLIAPVLLDRVHTDLAPGVIVRDGSRVLVGTGSHAVALTQVKPEGKAWMGADAWLRGLRGEAIFTS